MQLFLRVPIFTATAAEVTRRKQVLFEWWGDEGLPALRDRYRVSSASVQGLGPGHGFRLLQETDDPIEVNLPTRVGALVPKGLLLRLEILAALDYVDRRGATKRDDAFFIMIDGSGAFSFENVFTVLDALLAAPRPNVVMGYRPAGDTGMVPWRRAIELFEERLLLDVLGHKLPALSSEQSLRDSQAGCWGLCLAALKSLPLTARSYEIEYDLLASALANELPFRFVGPLLMKPRTTSEFGGGTVDERAIDNSIHKLYFIVHKLGITGEELVERLQSYAQEVDEDPTTALPALYVRKVRREFAMVGRVA